MDELNHNEWAELRQMEVEALRHAETLAAIVKSRIYEAYHWASIPGGGYDTRRRKQNCEEAKKTLSDLSNALAAAIMAQEPLVAYYDAMKGEKP